MYSETNMLVKGRNHILSPVLRFLHSTKQVIRGTTVYAHPRGIGVSNFSDSKLRRRTLTINPANTVSRRGSVSSTKSRPGIRIPGSGEEELLNMGEEGESFLIETGWGEALDMHDFLISHKSCDTSAAILVHCYTPTLSTAITESEPF
jgi:hypothetical protein